jgi:hypothetical protein
MTIPAKPSEFGVRSFEVRYPGELILLVCRESGHQQNRNGNLRDSEANLRKVVQEAGGIVAGVLSHIGPGWNCFWLIEAFAKARDMGIKKFLAETPCRYVRSREFHSMNNPDAQAGPQEWKILQEIAGLYGITLMTHIHPDSSPQEIREYHQQRGREEKRRVEGRKMGGKDHKKVKRQKRGYLVRAKAERLWTEGWSMNRIAAELGVTKSHVQYWVRLLPRHSFPGCQSIGEVSRNGE